MEQVQLNIWDIRWNTETSEVHGEAGGIYAGRNSLVGAARYHYEDGTTSIYAFERKAVGAQPQFVRAWELDQNGNDTPLAVQVELIGALSTIKAAEFVGLSHDRIKQACENGELGKWIAEPWKAHNGGHWEIDYAELMKWMPNRRKAGRPKLENETAKRDSAPASDDAGKDVIELERESKLSVQEAQSELNVLESELHAAENGIARAQGEILGYVGGIGTEISASYSVLLEDDPQKAMDRVAELKAKVLAAKQLLSDRKAKDEALWQSIKKEWLAEKTRRGESLSMPFAPKR